MGRSVLIEEVIEEKILKLFGTTKWESGVLIGQSTLQRDFVIHLAVTPSQKTDDESDKEGIKRSNAIKEFDEEWFVQHCRQVNWMLTGGLQILGIFVFGPPEVRTKLQAKFRQTLFAVQKMICSDLPLARLNLQQTACISQIMVQVCSATKKTTCYTIDVSDSKANFQPSDLKYQNFVTKWIPVQCSLELEVNFMLQKKLDCKNCFSNLKSGLMPTLSKIANSLATVNGAILSDEQQLVAEKQKRTSSDKISMRNVELYMTQHGFKPDIQQCMRRQVSLVGAVKSRAYLHPKATFKEAVHAIKTDVIRSLLTRCRLLCEDMSDTIDQEQDDENENFIRWELPKRIFAPICGGHVNISDCVFKDEETQDILNRILELMDVSLSEESLIMSDEQFADIATCDELLGDKVEIKQQNNERCDGVAKSSSTSYQFLGASVGAITVLMAALMKWFWNE